MREDHHIDLATKAGAEMTTYLDPDQQEAHKDRLRATDMALPAEDRATPLLAQQMRDFDQQTLCDFTKK